MSVNQLYHTWVNRILQLHPSERLTRVRNMAWLIVGIYQSKSVHLSKVATHIPGQAVVLSSTRRLDRFLENAAIRVRAWYKPVAQTWLRHLAGQEIHLIVDGSKIGFGHQLLIVALAYRRRALPLAWTWVNCRRGHSSGLVQLALLQYVQGLLPPQTRVRLTGDAEFGAVQVLKQLNLWGWKFALRQKSSHLVKLRGQNQWQPLGSLIHNMGQSCWCEDARLTQQHAYTVNLLAYWAVGEKEPWLLATNLPSFREALRTYQRRMWIEEMFGDLKKHGFDLESTHLRDFRKLSRLTLAVALLYVSLVAQGAQTLKAGLRHLVDRADRRDLSVFRIGWNMLQRHLTNAHSFSIALCPFSNKLSGS
jgi:hypothetical protein